MSVLTEDEGVNVREFVNRESPQDFLARYRLFCSDRTVWELVMARTRKEHLIEVVLGISDPSVRKENEVFLRFEEELSKHDGKYFARLD